MTGNPWILPFLVCILRTYRFSIGDKMRWFAGIYCRKASARKTIHRKTMNDQTEEEVFVLGDVADLTLGEGDSDNEDKRKIYN
jgi:hypothetical protein